MAQNKIKKNCSLEVAETNSVVVEILKLVLAGDQVRDEFVNVNKMPTNLEGGVVESAFFGVFSQKKILDCYIYMYRGLSNNKQRNQWNKTYWISIRDIHVDLHFSRLFIKLYFTLRDIFYCVTASPRVK